MSSDFLPNCPEKELERTVSQRATAASLRGIHSFISSTNICGVSSESHNRILGTCRRNPGPILFSLRVCKAIDTRQSIRGASLAEVLPNLTALQNHVGEWADADSWAALQRSRLRRRRARPGNLCFLEVPR